MDKPSINTLISDIDCLLSGQLPQTIESVAQLEEKLAFVSQQFGEAMQELFTRKIRQYFEMDEEPERGWLRLSKIGKNPCELWQEARNPSKREKLPSNVNLKFLYGDLIEELMLSLAVLAGHKVEHRQKEVEVEGVLGHLDAVIDDEVVDVKSASTYSFKKFKDGTLADNDSFGYIYQISSYAKAMDKQSGYFLAVDKTLGHFCLLKQSLLPDPVKRIQYLKSIKDLPEAPDTCVTVTEKNGNVRLDVPCSYCPHKMSCHPELRAFVYSNAVKFYTHVESEPRVLEITDKLKGQMDSSDDGEMEEVPL